MAATIDRRTGPRRRPAPAVVATAVVLATTTVLLAPATPSAQAAGSCRADRAGTVLRSAPGAGRTVALTFDDNDARFLPQILAVLKRNNVRATFFDTGAQDVTMPATVAAAAAQGHLVEPHTWEHRAPSAVNGWWSRGYLDGQIRRTAAQQQRITGVVPCWFRPPFGTMTNVRSASRAAGMQVVLWSVDSQDWKQPGRLSAAATARIVTNATDLRYADPRHPIVLMHGGKASHESEAKVSSYRGNTVAALQKVIDWYRARGYRFVAVDGTSGLRRP